MKTVQHMKGEYLFVNIAESFQANAVLFFMCFSFHNLCGNFYFILLKNIRTFNQECWHEDFTVYAVGIFVNDMC